MAENPALRIAVLADGLDSERLARRIHERLCVRLPEGAATQLSVWRFEWVSHARTRRVANRNIREADVVMVAVDGNQRLPLEIEDALGEWVLGPEATRFGLVEILRGVTEDHKHRAPAHIFLEELARKADADFLSHVVSPAEEGPFQRIHQ